MYIEKVIQGETENEGGNVELVLSVHPECAVYSRDVHGSIFMIRSADHKPNTSSSTLFAKYK